MKMRLSGFLMFAILSISIVSYGFSGSAFADSHNIPPISAQTELPTYENGDRVLVDGTIRDFDPDIHSNANPHMGAGEPGHKDHKGFSTDHHIHSDQLHHNMGDHCLYQL